MIHKAETVGFPDHVPRRPTPKGRFARGLSFAVNF